MRRTVSSATGLLFFLALIGVFFSRPAPAQIRIAPEGQRPAIDEMLQRGMQLETQDRWGEALTHYEKSLQNYPNERRFEERARISRIHFDLARRYSDSSFAKTLSTLSYRDSLGLYSEILEKIHAYYVQRPRWKELVEYGIANLDVALTEAVFLKRHLDRKTREQIEAFRRELNTSIAMRPVRSRREAIDAANMAARLAHQRLGLSPAATLLEFICGASGCLDNYSTFLTSGQLNEIYSQIDGNFVGLGVELKGVKGNLLILDVIPGSPADRGGIQPGDQITFVDGKSTKGLTTDQAADLLQGTEGSIVDLIIVSREQQPRRLRLRREHVNVPSVNDVQMIDRQAGIGYLRLAVFQKTTSRDLDTAIWKLHREGMKSLIVDLRGNPGGLLTSSVEAADKFIGRGMIVSTRGRNPNEDYNYTAHRVGTWQVPLVVLIDGDSASASEIFAGAIRDHRRGIIVGQKSYGKGSVQGIFPLNQSGSGVKLTTAKFYSPSGHPISKVGVKPDVVVHTVAKGRSQQVFRRKLDVKDPVIAAGIQVAQRQLAHLSKAG